MTDNTHEVFVSILVACYCILVPTLCAITMKRKGYSPFVGILLALFLHILGVLVCLVWSPSAKKQREQDFVLPAAKVKCQFCGQANVEGVTLCVHCNNYIRPISNSWPPQPTAASRPIRYALPIDRSEDELLPL